MLTRGGGAVKLRLVGVTRLPFGKNDGLIRILYALIRSSGVDVGREGGGPGPDIVPLSAKGMPWAQLAQDGSDYFDYHHTADDTLDKIDPRALDQQVAAYAVLAWLAAEYAGDFGRLPRPER